MSRPETGAMRFEGDWRGIFIRGDNAAGYLSYLQMAQHDPKYLRMLSGLITLLGSAYEGNKGVSTQEMKPFEQCSCDVAMPSVAAVYEYDLKALRAAAEEALKSAGDSQIEGAKNWAALHCVAALRVEDDQGGISYRVEVEETSPDNHDLQQWLSGRLDEAGFLSVAVYTEW